MNFKRLATALTLGLVVSGTSTWMLGRKLSTHAAVRAPDQHFLSPARPMEAGEIIKPEDLITMAWPADMPLQGAFAKPETLLGRTLLYPLGKGQPFTEKMVTAPGAGSGLAAKIPEGMRAVALRSDEIIGVAGFLQPASHVDVIATVSNGRTTEPTTFTVLQDAEVLAAGKQMQPDPDGKPTVVNVVTLLLKPEDAERAVLASMQGTIHFVLRNGSDKIDAASGPIDLSQLMGAAAPVPAASPTPAVHVAAAPPRVAPVRPVPKQLTVETIAGDKSTTDTFAAGPR